MGLLISSCFLKLKTSLFPFLLASIAYSLLLPILGIVHSTSRQEQKHRFLSEVGKGKKGVFSRGVDITSETVLRFHTQHFPS